jgi:hypothetical protein
LRGYFLAASGIGEFQKSIHAKGVVSQLVKLSEVDLDIEKQRSVSSMEPIAKEAKVILQAMERRLVISDLIKLLHLMYDNMDDYYNGLILRMCDIARLVLEVDSKNKEAIFALKKLFNGTNFSRRASAKVLIENKIEDSEAKEIYDKTQQEINQAIQDYVKNNSENNIVNSLIQYGKYLQDTMEMYVDKKDTNELIKQLMNSEGLMLIATIKELETVGYSNIDVIMAMIKLLITSKKRLGDNSDYEFIGSEIVNSLLQVTPNELLPPIIYFFRKYLTDKVCQTDYVLYKVCYKLLWHCAQNMSYRDFYYAWQGELLQFQN